MRSEDIREKAEEDFFERYNKRSIYLLFAAFFVGNILTNVDHGALPSCFAQVQIALNIDEF